MSVSLRKDPLVTDISYYQLTANVMHQLSHVELLHIRNILRDHGFHHVRVDNVEQEKMHYPDGTSSAMRETSRVNAYGWYAYDVDEQEG